MWEKLNRTAQRCREDTGWQTGNVASLSHSSRSQGLQSASNDTQLEIDGCRYQNSFRYTLVVTCDL